MGTNSFLFLDLFPTAFAEIIKILDVFDNKPQSPREPSRSKTRVVSHNSAENGDLRTLLAAEKVVGYASTASAARTAAQAHGNYDKMGNFKSLNGVYLLVEDATQVHRPIYVEAFQLPQGPDDLPSWPMLYSHAGEGRCPFTAPSSQRHAHSKNASRPLRVELDEEAVMRLALPSSASHSSAQQQDQNQAQTQSSLVRTTMSNPDLHARLDLLQQQQQQPGETSNVEDDSLSVLPAQPASGMSIATTTAGVPDLAASAASTMPGTNTTSTAWTTDQTVPTANQWRRNPRVEALQRRTTVMGPAPSTLTPGSRAPLQLHPDHPSHHHHPLHHPSHSSSHVDPASPLTSLPPNLPSGIKSQVRAYMAARSASGQPIQPSKVGKKRSGGGGGSGGKNEQDVPPVPGYCENCRVKYEDFDTHVESKRHLRFATDDSNFVELDALLGQIARKPLGVTVVR